MPTPVNPPFGCRFHTPCPIAMDICRNEEPVFKDAGSGHSMPVFLIYDFGFTHALKGNSLNARVPLLAVFSLNNSGVSVVIRVTGVIPIPPSNQVM